MTRPRRNLLFSPAAERRKVEKAAGLPADGIIIDLEDATAPSVKEEARRSAVLALEEIDFGDRERIVRINAVGSGLEEDDLEAILAGPVPPDAILVPKVESEAAIQKIAWHLGDTEIELLALIETSRGVVRLAEIAESSDRLTALVFGAEDLIGDVGGIRTPEGREVYVARSLVALHAAAQGLQAIDSPCIRLDDADALRAEARQALELGYAGKLAIHPAQLGPIEEIFTPSDEELARAERVLDAYEQHRDEGRGVFELEGRMIDMPMVRAAERVLDRSRR